MNIKNRNNFIFTNFTSCNDQGKNFTTSTQKTRNMPEFLQVTKEESNQKLMNFLQRRFDLSNAEVQKLARKGEIRINNKKSEPFERVQENDEIRIPPFVLYRTKNSENSAIESIPKNKSTHSKNSDSKKYDIEKIYEDNELLVISKPYGLAIQGGSKQEISLTSILQEEYKNSNFTPTIAHRLDKDTSGLVLIGKTYNCLQELHAAFADKSNSNLKKIYHARVEHNSPNTTITTGTWEDYLHIAKDKQGKEKTFVTEKNLNIESKLALSEVEIIKTSKNFIDLEIFLITGRKHQIRVQCAHRNIPILGDTKYGASKADRLYLHASKIIWKEHEFYSKASWL